MDDVFLRRIPTRCPTCDKLEPCGNNYCAEQHGKALGLCSSQIDADYERYGKIASWRRSCRRP